MTSRAGLDGMPGAWYRPIRCFGNFRTSLPTFDQASIYVRLAQINSILCFGFDFHLFRLWFLPFRALTLIFSGFDFFRLWFSPFQVASFGYQPSFAWHCSCAHRTCSVIVNITSNNDYRCQHHHKHHRHHQHFQHHFHHGKVHQNGDGSILLFCPATPTPEGE